MVLESLVNPFKADRNPWEMFFIGFLYSSVGIALSLWIFLDQASLIMVFLTVMACIPVVYNTMIFEERKDLVIDGESKLLKEHNKAIVFLMFLFVGVTLSSVVWYIFLPPATINLLFDKQTQTIQSINNMVSGSAAQQFSVFFKIFFNNIKVLSFAILFAFIYCAGAIFILTWNATVIGTAIGNFIRSNLSDYAASMGLVNLGSYFHIVSIGLLKYAVHGIPEIIAYFYGGLAGGIISVAIVKHHYSSEKFSNILFDASELLIISIAFLLAAAFLEVFVTPVLF